MTSVLVVAPEGDQHGDAVQQALQRAGTTVGRAAVDILGEGFSCRPGDPITVGGHRVTTDWAIWWHRTGSLPPVWGAGGAEQDLAHAEATALLLGALLAVDPAWVDRPAAVERAEHTLLQLAVARACGAPVPDTLAGSDLVAAAEFLHGGPTVAKAVSSGPGLAPFAGPVTEEMLPALAGAPALLQRQVPSVADLRVIVVADRTLAWRRGRSPDDPVDWRASDPNGHGFTPVPVPSAVAGSAVRTCRALGLTTCVQDWVVDTDGTCWFLEANPVGRWLFLPGAEQTVPDLLAEHLIAAATGRRAA